MTAGATPLDDFWEASSLSSADAAAFGARLAAGATRVDGIHPFTGPGAPIALSVVSDRFQRMLASRHSERSFGDELLSGRDVTRLLAATGPRPGGRVVPEAGGLDAVFTYVVGRRVEGPCAGLVARYDHRAHAVAPVGPVPDDDTLRRLFLFDEHADLPQAVLVFVLDPEPVVSKYGARAGRFLLQQVGHAAQNVGLRLAQEGRRGYLLGGGLDREVLTVLGLAHTRARYGGAMACGR